MKMAKEKKPKDNLKEHLKKRGLIRSKKGTFIKANGGAKKEPKLSKKKKLLTDVKLLLGQELSDSFASIVVNFLLGEDPKMQLKALELLVKKIDVKEPEQKMILSPIVQGLIKAHLAQTITDVELFEDSYKPSESS